MKGWLRVGRWNDISLYYRKEKSSRVIGVGGTLSLPCSRWDVLDVIKDVPGKKNWGSRLEKVKLIENLSGLDMIEYCSIKLPFPVKSRDFVYRYRFEMLDKKKTMRVVLNSIDHPKAPHPKGVRGFIHKGIIEFKENTSNQTLVTVKMLSEPRGDIPRWLFNMLQVEWPYRTLSGLRSEILKKNKAEQSLSDLALGIEV